MFKEPFRQARVSCSESQISRAGLEQGWLQKDDGQEVSCGRQTRKRKAEGLDHSGWENLESYHPHGESQQKGEDQEENWKLGRKPVLRVRNMHQLSVRTGSQVLPEVLDVSQMCPVSMEKKPVSYV